MFQKNNKYMKSIQKKDFMFAIAAVVINMVPFYLNCNHKIIAHVAGAILSIMTFCIGTSWFREKELNELNEELDEEAYELYQVLTKMGDFDLDRSIEILTSIKAAKDKHAD